MWIQCSILLTLSVTMACGGAPPKADSTWQDEDVELGTAPRADGPAERSRALPPDRALEYPAVEHRRSQRRFRGRRIDFDVKDADLHNVFRLIADVGGVNVVVGDGVSGSVTMSVRQVPWDQVLDTIIRTKGLHMELSGNVIMITAKER